MATAAVLTTIGEAVFSSGGSVLIWNFWNSRKVEKAAKKAEKRNDVREPFVLDSIELSNINKVTEILHQGIEELEDSKKRLLDDNRGLKDNYTDLEDKMESCTNENRRLREELVDVHMELNDLKKSVPGD